MIGMQEGERFVSVCIKWGVSFEMGRGIEVKGKGKGKGRSRG